MASNFSDLVHEDEVILVLADSTVRLVGMTTDVEVVDLEELRRLGVRGAGHAGYFFIQAEVVLEGDRGEGPVAARDLDVLLRLDGLVEAVRVPAAVEDTPGELVDDLDEPFLDDVVDVLIEEDHGPSPPG